MYTITDYKPHFHNAVIRLGEDTFDEACHAMIRAAVRDRSVYSRVVLAGRTVIGFVIINENKHSKGLPDGLEVSFLCIDEKHQGKGLGTFLLNEVKELEFDSIWLEVSKDNLDAKALYERIGFSEWREIRNGIYSGYVLGYSKLRREWLPRLRSREHRLKDGITAPCSARPQSDSTLASRSP